MSEPRNSDVSFEPWTPPSVEELQALIPEYEIESLLGRGGMGAVYRGRQVSLGRTVAIKLLPENLANNGENDGDDPHQFVERFKREARVMASLDHPAILAVYDFGQTEAGHLFFVMEYIDGMDIQQYIRASGGKVDPEHAVAIVSHVLDALAYAHGQGVVHRDVKPANVLINQSGHVKLADFGLVKRLAREDEDLSTLMELTLPEMAMGTPDYMAPETLEAGGEPDHRADLYAVGVMLYQMLTGRLPRGLFKLPSEVNPDLDPRFDELIHAAMEGDVGERFQSAEVFRTLLNRLLTQPVAKVESGQDSESVDPVLSRGWMKRKGVGASWETETEESAGEPVGGASDYRLAIRAALLTTFLLIVVGGYYISSLPEEREKGGDTTTDSGSSTAEPSAGDSAAEMGEPPVGTEAMIPEPAEVAVEPSKPESDPIQADAESGLPVEANANLPKEKGDTDPSGRADGLVANGEWQDVLGAISTAPFFSSHDWRVEDGVLTGELPVGKYQAVRGIESEPLGNYEARMRFSLEDGTDAVSMYLPTPAGGAQVFLWDSRKLAGVQGTATGPVIEGRLPHGIQDGEVHEFHVTIRDNDFDLLVDDVPVFSSQAVDWSDWNQREFYGRTDPPILGVRLAALRAEFHSFEVRIPADVETIEPLSPDLSKAGETTPPEPVVLRIEDIPEARIRIDNFRKARREQLLSRVYTYRTMMETERATNFVAGRIEMVGLADIPLQTLKSYAAQLREVMERDQVEALPSAVGSKGILPEQSSLEATFYRTLAAHDSDLLDQLKQSLAACVLELRNAKQSEEAQVVEDYRVGLQQMTMTRAGVAGRPQPGGVGGRSLEGGVPKPNRMPAIAKETLSQFRFSSHSESTLSLCEDFDIADDVADYRKAYQSRSTCGTMAGYWFSYSQSRSMYDFPEFPQEKSFSFGQGVVEVDGRIAVGKLSSWFLKLADATEGNGIKIRIHADGRVTSEPSAKYRQRTKVEQTVLHRIEPEDTVDFRTLSVIVGKQNLALCLDGKVITPYFALDFDLTPGVASIGSRSGDDLMLVEIDRFQYWSKDDLRTKVMVAGNSPPTGNQTAPPVMPNEVEKPAEHLATFPLPDPNGFPPLPAQTGRIVFVPYSEMPDDFENTVFKEIEKDDYDNIVALGEGAGSETIIAICEGGFPICWKADGSKIEPENVSAVKLWSSSLAKIVWVDEQGGTGAREATSQIENGLKELAEVRYISQTSGIVFAIDGSGRRHLFGPYKDYSNIVRAFQNRDSIIQAAFAGPTNIRILLKDGSVLQFRSNQKTGELFPAQEVCPPQSVRRLVKYSVAVTVDGRMNFINDRYPADLIDSLGESIIDIESRGGHLAAQTESGKWHIFRQEKGQWSNMKALENALAGALEIRLMESGCLALLPAESVPRSGLWDLGELIAARK